MLKEHPLNRLSGVCMYIIYSIPISCLTFLQSYCGCGTMLLKATRCASGPLPMPFKYSRMLCSPTTPCIWAGFINCCSPLQMQCPAVSIQRSCIMVPPQKCPPRRVKLTIKGISLRSASLPPTILGLRTVQGSGVTIDRTLNILIDYN